MPILPCSACQRSYTTSIVTIKLSCRPNGGQPLSGEKVHLRRQRVHRLRKPRAQPDGEAESGTPGSSPTEQKAEMADGGESESLAASLQRTSGLIAALLAVIALFLGATYVGGNVMSALQQGFQENVTFTRKDFVPYSERQRLEAEYRALDEAKQGGPGGTETSTEQEIPQTSKKLLEELLPVNRPRS